MPWSRQRCARSPPSPAARPRRRARPPPLRHRRASAPAPSAAPDRRASSICVAVRPSRSTFSMRRWPVGIGRDLRQVRDAHDLVVAREAPQQPTDRIRRAPADAGIHLVEDERRRLVGARQHGLERQRDARQLAAGRDARQRPRRLSRVGLETELDRVHAVRRARRWSICDREGSMGEAQILQERADRTLEPSCARFRRAAVSSAAAARAASNRRSASIERSSRCSSMLRSRSHLRPAAAPYATSSEPRPRRTCASARTARPRRASSASLSVAASATDSWRRRSSSAMSSSSASMPAIRSARPSISGSSRASSVAARDCRGDVVARRSAVRGEHVVCLREQCDDALGVARDARVGRAAPRPRRRVARPPRSRPRRGRPAPGAARARPDRWSARAARPRSRAAPHGVGNRLAQFPWPPYASSMSRCQRLDSSRCCSCWPWISTSGSTTWASRAAVTVSSSMRATLRPSADTSRTQMSGSGAASNVEQRFDARARGAVAHETRVGARAHHQPSASISSDLPAPVSPVMTVRPGPNATRTRSMSARSRTASSRQHQPILTAAEALRRAAAPPSAAAAPRTAAAPLRLDEAHRPLAARGPRPVAGLDRVVVLAVDADDAGRPIDDAHAHRVRRADDDRPDRRQVRRDRRHDQLRAVGSRIGPPALNE